MSCRPFIFRDLRCRNDIICRSCLAARAKQPAQAWRPASYSTQASQSASKARPRPQPRSQPRPNTDITRQPSKEELARYLEGLKSLQTPDKAKTNADEFSVRFFEQGDRDRRELSNEQAFGESIGGIDASELRDNLFNLRSKLGSQDDRDAFREVLSQIGEGWGKVNSAEDVEKVIAKMEDYARSIDVELKQASADLPKGVLEQLIGDVPDLSLEGDSSSDQPQDSIPQVRIDIDEKAHRRRKLMKFNSVISRFVLAEKASGTKAKGVQSLYKAYHSTRRALAQNWSDVPPAVWEVLWRAFSSERDDVNEMSRIALLARDMSNAGVTLRPAQQVLAIEAVFVEGWESKAIDNWKRCVGTLGAETSEVFQAFWELGARMYCRVGDLEQAERAMNKLLSRNMSPRILIPLIRTSCEQGTEEGRQKAWATYRQMRELLGKDMTLTDYDQVISYFLTANYMENALYAFVDMMSEGRIDLARQRFLPSVVANKFFLGKWLKRLIGAGDLNGAFSVVKFMREKGVEAAPIHLNGLIGAWQRSGGADDLEKADALGWELIESRLKFVARRKSSGGESPDDGSTPSTQSSSSSSPTDPPRATSETFWLLAENYRQRGLHGRLQELWDAFRAAEISPDAFMMNQLIESLIQEGQPQEAVALYHSLVEGSRVVPDPYTFSALWKTLGVNRYQIRDTETLAKETEATRAMFKETVKHKDVFLQSDAGGGSIDGQLARKMLHTFRRLRDNAGLLVAVTALKEVFGFLPPETLVLEMVMGTTKLAWDTPSQRRRLTVAKTRIDRELLAWAGFDPAKLEGEGRRGEALYALLQKRFWPEGGSEAEKRRVFVEVARQMGRYDAK
ncbi:hypothetical protein BBK36DRAFT_1140888 [Trichoderma citrinoviride]|uniref:Pentacotripeptide-repeat region of PRORP domain-containing protein n=1 Tax=Trichoderma citrinoviride TaxID=58853 RepID=A0A2T4BCT1_9HYPO|nr:hypothetical protein BBK36DRAFT_1140888 [Trichoderma citrinoviride]PTB67137.1 hypothetical protein BBK36DRAFT_1140888 [Trichoderma citrinoviride]